MAKNQVGPSSVTLLSVQPLSPVPGGEGTFFSRVEGRRARDERIQRSGSVVGPGFFERPCKATSHTVSSFRLLFYSGRDTKG